VRWPWLWRALRPLLRLEFERIAEVRLKGFLEPTEVFMARASEA